MAFRFRPQDFQQIKKTHSELYETINLSFPTLSDVDKGKIAGIAIESSLKGELIFQGAEYESEEDI